MAYSAYIPRLIEEQVLKTPDDKALVLFGARQIGKTTLLKRLFEKENALWLTGDDPEDVDLLAHLQSSADISTLLYNQEVLVIDEAQRIPSIGMLLKRMVDLQIGCRIIATGSSSLELAGGVMESAAGRLKTKRLWPLSINELADDTSWMALVKEINQRLVFGMYPCAVKNPAEAREDLTDLYLNLAFKDIFALSRIRNHEKFKRMVRFLAYNIGQVLSYETIGRECELSSPCVADYLSLLEQSFIIRVLPSFSRNFSNELKKSKKIYFCDLGIRNAAINDFSPFSTRNDTERGALWENFFVIERMKYHDYRRTGVNLYFWRNKFKNEVDLVEVDGDNLNCFECKVTKDNVTLPEAFARAYPQCTFSVATAKNFYRYFQK